VVKESPAEKKGMAKGDLVLEIDGRKLSGVIDFYVKMMHKEIGEPIEIKYVRLQGLQPETRTVRLTMEAKPLPDGRKLAEEFFQMEISELTDAVARKFGYDKAYPILIITDAERQGVAAQAGLTGGDLILEVNNTAVRNLKEFSLEMEKVNEGDIVKLKIMRIKVSAFGQVRRIDTVSLKAQTQKTSRHRFL